jgi:hypothetical protein
MLSFDSVEIVRPFGLSMEMMVGIKRAIRMEKSR